MNIELLEEIETTGGKLAKEALLKGADGELRLFLEQCLDPDITYGITIDESDARLFKSIKPITEKLFWGEMKDLLDKLAKRRLTGNAAQSAMWKIVQCAPDEIHAKWASRFINKNLRAGFDISTYNKAFGAGTVDKFAVQLADTYEGEELPSIVYHQPKLDGNRVVLIDSKAMSRNGKEYPNCEHVINDILKLDPHFFNKWVIDGEMMGDLGFDKSSGALRRINEKNREKATFTYWAFDMVSRDEWNRRKTVSLEERLPNLRVNVSLINSEFIKVVPTGVLKNPTHAKIMELCDEYVSQGFEGAMVKDPKSPYVFKRGKNLLKVKKFFDIDMTVDGFYEGKGKHKGRLGGLLVTEGKISCKVGSGFDDIQRDDIWKNQKKWFGAVVQIQYQDKTKDGSLRFPVFIMRRKDKE